MIFWIHSRTIETTVNSRSTLIFLLLFKLERLLFCLIFIEISFFFILCWHLCYPSLMPWWLILILLKILIPNELISRLFWALEWLLSWIRSRFFNFDVFTLLWMGNSSIFNRFHIILDIYFCNLLFCSPINYSNGSCIQTIRWIDLKINIIEDQEIHESSLLLFREFTKYKGLRVLLLILKIVSMMICLANRLSLLIHFIL